MRDIETSTQTLAGSLLLASPQLLDPNFDKSVILLSVHSEDEGAMGVIINRPSGQTMSDIDDGFSQTNLAQVPVYFGGPVSNHEVILAAWQCHPEEGTFKLYFGISDDKARELREDDPTSELRAFLGYTGWSKGQLEAEIMHESWVISHVNTAAISEKDGVALWHTIFKALEPDADILPDMPDDPSLN